MTISTNVRVNGAWKQLNEIYAKVDGTWEEMDEVYVRVNGVWEKVFPSFLPGSIVYTTTGNHSFVVPVGVTNLNYIVIGGGAGGAGGSDNDPYTSGGGGGGAGGLISGTLTVTGGETLICTVGGGGGAGGEGGPGGTGGTSLIRRGVTNLAVVSGGHPATYWQPGHYPTGGLAGNAYSQDGGDGQTVNGDHDVYGGKGGGVPGYSAGGNNPAHGAGGSGGVPGAGGGGGFGEGTSGSYSGGKGGRGRIYLSW